MTVLEKLNFVEFNPLLIAARRRKLMAKIYEQIQHATNKDYIPNAAQEVTNEQDK